MNEINWILITNSLNNIIRKKFFTDDIISLYNLGYKGKFNVKELDEPMVFELLTNVLICLHGMALDEERFEISPLIIKAFSKISKYVLSYENEWSEVEHTINHFNDEIQKLNNKYANKK